MTPWHQMAKALRSLKSTVLKKLIDRLHDTLLSVYIFNEHRGYVHLDQLAVAFAKRYPEDTKILAAVRKHANDERRHYQMFRQWFDENERMPLEVNHRYGYCDLIVQALMGQPLSELDPSEVVADEQSFYRLCRLIMITEMRGMQQVDVVLRNPLLRCDPALVEIFETIKKDEPSHCFPYQAWLKLHDQHLPSRAERLADGWVHYSLTLVKLPLLFLSFWLRRRDRFPCGAAARATTVVGAPYDLIHQLNDEQTQQLFVLFQNEWWTNRRTLPETKKMLCHTPYIFGLIDKETGILAGFARVFSDQVFKALIMDVIVHPAHRNKGLGSILLNAIRSHQDLKDVGHFELYCLKDMVPFYERWGFTTEQGDVRFMRASNSMPNL